MLSANCQSHGEWILSMFSSKAILLKVQFLNNLALSFSALFLKIFSITVLVNITSTMRKSNVIIIDRACGKQEVPSKIAVYAPSILILLDMI